MVDRRRLSPKNLGQLESKIAITDLVNKPSELRLSQSKLDNRQIKRVKSLVDTHRISNRPIVVIRATDSDILHFKEGTHSSEERHDRKGTRNDVYEVAIPVLPADEMDRLTFEIKLWKKTQRYLRFLFLITQLCGVGGLVIVILFMTKWYAGEEVVEKGKHFYNSHMALEQAKFFLLILGMLLFRIAPNARMKTLILIHAAISVFIFLAFGVSIYLAIEYRTQFTGLPVLGGSIHSCIGLTAGVLYGLAMISGLCFIAFPNTYLLHFHVPLGKVTFMFCGAGAISGFFFKPVKYLGINYKPGSENIPTMLLDMYGIMLLLVVLGARITLSDFIFKRRPKPQWDVVVYRNLEPIEEAFMEVHFNYDAFESWVKQINHTRLRVIRLPRLETHSLEESYQ